MICQDCNKDVPKAIETAPRGLICEPCLLLYVSWSRLETFRDNVTQFCAMYVTKTMPRPEPTPQMALGTALHVMLLQPDELEHKIAILPPGDGRTKAVKDAREELKRTLNGQTVITVEQAETAKRMTEAVWANPLARQLLETEGEVEKLVCVEHPEFGKLKGCLDKLFTAGHIMDIKSTAYHQPNAFQKHAHSMGYHRQASFYEDLRDLYLGEGEGRFFNLAISTTEGGSEAVVFEVSPDAKFFGRTENYESLRELRRREQEGDWSGRWSQGIHVLNLPGWAYKQAQMETR